ncbi:MAG: hypothetical protein IJ875_02715 [Solobacterium sp.]|nr:hypothetical protein [Solobacterium sp.]
MENKLKKLFDYHRFSKNEHLQQIIDDTNTRVEEKEALILDENSLSFAVGGVREVEDKTDKDFLEKDKLGRAV